MAKTAPPEPDFYLVIFYDILGNGDNIESWADPEKWKTDRETTSRAYFETIKSIVDIRNSFQFVAKGMNDSELPPGVVDQRNQIDPKALPRIDKLRLGTIRHQSFSDTNIWFLKITEDELEGRCYSKAMNSMLTGLSYCHLDALSNGHFCRAGVSLGIATDMGGLTDGDEVVGPALVDAYLLERDMAQSARLVVHQQLADFLDQRIEQITNELDCCCDAADWFVLKYELHYLNDMRSMIVNDSDGQLIIDFSGQIAARGMVQVMRNQDGDPTGFYQRVLDEVDRQVQVNQTDGNKKHLERALSLQKYLNLRKEYWI